MVTELAEVGGGLGRMDATVVYGTKHLNMVGAQRGAVHLLRLRWRWHRGITETCDCLLTDNHTAVSGDSSLMHLWDGRYTPLKTGWRPGHALVNHSDITVPPGICNVTAIMEIQTIADRSAQFCTNDSPCLKITLPKSRLCFTKAKMILRDHSLKDK